MDLPHPFFGCTTALLSTMLAYFSCSFSTDLQHCIAIVQYQQWFPYYNRSSHAEPHHYTAEYSISSFCARLLKDRLTKTVRVYARHPPFNKSWMVARGYAYHIYIYIYLYRCGFICIYVFVCGNFFETYINIKMHGDMFLRKISFERYTWYLYLWYLCVTSGHTWFKPSKTIIPDRQNSDHGMIWKTCFLEKWWQCCLDPLRSTRVLFFSDQAIDQSRTEIVAATTFMVWSMLLTTVESWAK